jgi:hypothetical protein
MNWNELKKYKIEDIVLYINQELDKNKSLISISETLGVNESTIRKKITTNGYKRINNKFVIKNDKCNQECNTSKENKEITNNITNVFSNSEFKDNMLFLHNEIDILRNIIEQFKENDKSNTNVIELREGIKINLPESNIKRTTIRINEVVWDMFNQFVEENKPFDKHDLMGMALLEYMDKYKKD